MGREGDASELLDLVRSAEQGAFVATTPSGNPLPGTRGDEEQFVDVGEDAIDSPPTLPIAIPVTRLQAVTPAPPGRSTPPVLAILGVVALVGAVLALIAR